MKYRDINANDDGNKNIQIACITQIEFYSHQLFS